MSKLHFKGGPWTNAEDEVLKAGLAQYGLRDWERVASMLTKKTGSQCRERWENYLDPRLNIHEAWSFEEEEKLVELQSLFPNKFRLISEQLTRRTPHHYIRPAWLCEQRYLELKDEQEHFAKQQQLQGQDDAEKQTLEAFMAERRRRRNARKTHEERAARADTVSGERFDSEMLAMATSRLANQDQKKGLRKERQRQLGEAAFLARLESNREAIESGTMSLRQSRKMRKALKEDQQASGLTDLVEEDDDEEAPDDDESDGEGDAEGSTDAFEAIDMYEDQQQAGLVKKQRVLMKDLTEQQRMIQQRQMLSGQDGDEEGGNSSSRARAALTGVNQDLLKQLTAAPSSTPSSESVPLVRDKPASSTVRIGSAAEAQQELSSSLAGLFAALPSATAGATRSDAMPPPLPLPPLKRPREALPAVPLEDSHTVSSSSARPDSEDTSAPSLFSALNIPAPRKQAKREASAEEPSPYPAAATPSPIPPSASPTPEAKQPALDPLDAPLSAEEEALYVLDARQWVAVECERAATTRASERGSTPSGLPPITAAERRAAEELVASEMRRCGSGTEVPNAEALAAVQAYVADTPAYVADVNVQNALHDLSLQVAAQVQDANALLRPVREEWEQVLSAAMLSPKEAHVLRGFVGEDGQLKGVHKDGGTTSSPSVAAYVCERLVGQLDRARQALRFMRSLREREQLKMRRDLDDAEHRLRQLQARERTLQDMYRQKRAQ